MRSSPTLISVAYSSNLNSKITFKRTDFNPFNVAQSLPVTTSHTCNNTTLKLPIIKRKSVHTLAKRNAAMYCKAAILKGLDNFDSKEHCSLRYINPSNCFPKRSSIVPICLYKMPRKSRFISPLAFIKKTSDDDIVGNKNFQIKKILGKVAYRFYIKV